MAKPRPRRYDIFLGGERIATKLALSEKEALDLFRGALPQEYETLEEFAAAMGWCIDDYKVLPHVSRGDA